MPGKAIGTGETAVNKTGHDYMPSGLHVLVNVERQPTICEVIANAKKGLGKGEGEGVDVSH